MCSNLRDHQLKIITYIQVVANIMVTTDKKFIIGTHTRRKESKHNTKDSHQITREEKKKNKNELQKQPENNKMAVSSFL